MTIDLRAAAAGAREASRVLSTLDTPRKNAVIMDLAAGLLRRRGEILAASAADLDAARSAGLAWPKQQRLALTEKNLAQLAEGLGQVAGLPDPVGVVTRRYQGPTGLRVQRVRIPLGVIAMIYEARPGVTVDAFALCFKAGNACILKGGKDAARSNAALAGMIHDTLRDHALPEGACTVVLPIDRDELRSLLALDSLIDLVIPRGGHDLIRFVADHSRIPTIQHFQGVCHIYVDESADLDRAVTVCVSAKTSAPATCNAAECFLVHRAVASALLPRLGAALAAAGVELRGDAEVCRAVPTAVRASEADFGREFLDLVCACKVVGGVDEAVAHIARHGSNHTEAILAARRATIEEFVRAVGSSCVAVNASTRFNDGFQLGLGAEIGISTTRLHAYGPMGLEELTTQRFVVEGDYDTR
ncbi:MAG: glutamate-5-semialdehyde dehydrogenase [Phycisphaerales bacterium]